MKIRNLKSETLPKTKNLQIDRWVNGNHKRYQRLRKRELGRLIRRLKKSDILICSEISRLGRNLLQIMTILNICIQKEVQVWTIKDNYRLGADIQSKVLAFAFSLSAEIERNLISQRTKESLARLKAGGKKLGRSFGSRNKKHILDGKEQDIVALLKKGVPKAELPPSRRQHINNLQFSGKTAAGSEFIRHNLRYTNSKSNEH